MNVIATLTVADRIALSLGGLGRAVAARIAGGAMQAVMIVLVWRRIRRIEGQILGLLARFRAGRLRASTVFLGRARGGPSGPRQQGLPRRFGWLLPLVPYEAACYAGQIRAVLAEPEMVALLAAAPQARRVLAPLCRMVGVEAAVLAPPGALAVPPEAGVDAGRMAGELDRLVRYSLPGGGAGVVVVAPWGRCTT